MSITLFNGALISLYFKGFSVRLCLLPEENSVYKYENDRLRDDVYVDCMWIWGRAVEPYDHCLEYFGLGPLGLISWLPGFSLFERKE